MLKIHELILTFFYLGKSKKAPGTVGSIGSVALWFFLTKWFFSQEISIANQNIFWTIFLIVIFLYGIFAIPIYAKKTGEIDHGSIVLDEVLGQVLALQATFFFIHENYFSQPNLILTHLFFSFVLFRFFDIKKPSVIGYCDRNFKTGFGVMFDDLLCGLVVAVIGIVIIFVKNA